MVGGLVQAQRVWSAACVVALLMMASSSFAEEKPYRFGTEAESYLLGGLTAGGSFGSLGGGGFVGGELSFARQHRLVWYGLYADGAYDFGHQAAMFTAGPELGWGPLGIDGGGGVRIGAADEPEVGAQGRVLLTLGMIGFFGRYSFWPESENEHVGQVGALIKLPFWNSSPVPEDVR